MKFAYFFMGIHTSSDGMAVSLVQIRPMEPGHLETAGMRIDLRIPIRTDDAGQALQSIASTALQAAQQLLPQSALAAWAKPLDQAPMQQPCFPEEARQDWMIPRP